MLASRRLAAATVVLVALGLVTSSLPDIPVALRAALTAPLVLLLPGLAWLSLLRPSPLDVTTRLILSVACSLMLVMFTGLALNWTQGGLSAPNWVLALGVLTLMPALLRLRTADPPSAGPRVPVRALMLVLPLAAAVVGLVMAYDLALRSALARRDDGFTQLWLVGDAAGCNGDLRLGLASYETETVGLQLTLSVDREPVTAWRWPSLEPGQRWETTIRTEQPAASVVEAQLTRADHPEAVYRWARLDCGGSTASGERPLP